MTQPIMNLFNNLEVEFQSVQKSLNDIDKNIIKITGKHPSIAEENPGRVGRFRNSNTSDRNFGTIKRKRHDSFEIEDIDSKYANKRSVQSHVIAGSWENKQRDQVLEEQKNDKKSLSRNKRMFGMILGTLEKFKNEESQRKDLQRRAEIEEKLDQAAESEREALKREREILFKERKTKRIQMRCLEHKLLRAEIHKEWEVSQQFIGNFIETKAKPHIFYLPAKHNQETLKRLQETKDKYRIILAEKRAKVQKELNEIDELYKKDDENNINDIVESQKNGHNDHEDSTNTSIKDLKKDDKLPANNSTYSDTNNNTKINVKQTVNKLHEDTASSYSKEDKKETTDDNKLLSSPRISHKNIQNYEMNCSQSPSSKSDKDEIKNESPPSPKSDKDFEPIYD